MEKSTTVLAFLVVAAGAVGAASFTSATVDRQATIDVAADNNGVVGLSPTGDVSEVTTSGDKLSIALNPGGTGLNPGGSFEYGDPADSSAAAAFNITNNADTTQDLTLSYTVTGTDSSPADNVQFKLYDAATDPTLVTGTATENNDYTITGLGPGESRTVVIVVDTTGQTSTDDLSGTLTISAN